MVELEVKIDNKDLFDFLLKHAYSGSQGILATVIGALAIMVGILRPFYLLVVLGIILIVYLPWTLFLKSASQATTNPVFKEPLHYLLDDEGITVSQNEVSTKVLWNDIVKAVSTPRSIIVYTGKSNATIFPKKKIGDQKSAVIQMISTHVDPKKVKIKE